MTAGLQVLGERPPPRWDSPPGRRRGRFRDRCPGGDFWGKFRRGNEAARAQLLASEWGRRAVATTLVSQVASAYYSLRTLDLELDISKRTLVSRQESLRLTQVRESGGVTSLIDVRQAEQLVYGASGVITTLRRRSSRKTSSA